MPSADALEALSAKLEAALARIPDALAEVSAEARSAHPLVDVAIALEAARALLADASLAEASLAEAPEGASLVASARLYATAALAEHGGADASALRDVVLRTRIAG